jgi:hypothetical protein
MEKSISGGRNVNQTIRTLLIFIGAVIVGAALLLGGIWIGRSSWGMAGLWPGAMMGWNAAPFTTGTGGSQLNAPMGPGMMGTYGQTDPGRPWYGHSAMGPGAMSSGMMGYGMMGSGMMSSGMMGCFGTSGLLAVDPLSPEDARQAVEDYLDGLDNPDFSLGEIMVFENHAYAQIVEDSTGIGAMEVLVDPVTKAVYPEGGPNMMWNLKYSAMSDHGMAGPRPGGMMGGYGQGPRGMLGAQPSTEISAEMPVSPAQAVTLAQEYLGTYLPGTEADDHADPFYGYYTLHVLRDGEVVGMLSVNGFNRQVFPHTWHGDFLEMAESDHD